MQGETPDVSQSVRRIAMATIEGNESREDFRDWPTLVELHRVFQLQTAATTLFMSAAASDSLGGDHRATGCHHLRKHVYGNRAI